MTWAMGETGVRDASLFASNGLVSLCWPTGLVGELPLLLLINPHALVKSLRWLIAYWTALHGSLWLADWDESDAFNNIPREDTHLLLADIAPGFARWLERYYGPLRIRPISPPHGLTEPFPHGAWWGT